MRVLSLILFLGLWLQILRHGSSLDVSPSGTRRSFVRGVAVTTAAGWIVEEARADPLKSEFPLASQGIIKPYSQIKDGWSAPVELATTLGSSRILANELSPLQQNNPFASRELYYPSFFFGSWNVTTTLKAKDSKNYRL